VADEAEKHERRNENFTRGRTSLQVTHLGHQTRRDAEETALNVELTLV